MIPVRFSSREGFQISILFPVILFGWVLLPRHLQSGRFLTGSLVPGCPLLPPPGPGMIRSLMTVRRCHMSHQCRLRPTLVNPTLANFCVSVFWLAFSKKEQNNKKHGRTSTLLGPKGWSSQIVLNFPFHGLGPSVVRCSSHQLKSTRFPNRHDNQRFKGVDPRWFHVDTPGNMTNVNRPFT